MSFPVYTGYISYLFSGTNAGETIQGTAYSDTIYGNGGNDGLYGNAGDDYIDGGAGYDYLVGGDGNDTLVDTGGDSFFGEGGNDVITVNGTFSAPVYIDGGADNDTININNFVTSGTIEGGSGYDVLTLQSSASVLRLGDLTVHGVERLYLNAGNYAVWSSTSQLEAFDRIDSGNYGQQLHFYLNNAGTLDLGDELGSQSAWISGYSYGTGSTIVTGSGADRIDGGALSDNLYGAAGDDYLNGGGGGDYLNGGIGNDTLYDTSGADTMIGDAGNDWIYELADHVTNTAIDGGADNDHIFINQNVTSGTIIGGSGFDTLDLSYANAGSVDLRNFSMSGVEQWVANQAIVYANASQLNDLTSIVHTSSSAINIFNTSGGYIDLSDVNTGGARIQLQNYGNTAMTVIGTAGGDQLVAFQDSNPNGFHAAAWLAGGGGNDLLMGGWADDTLNGGTGADILNGGGGKDTFVFDNFTRSGGITNADTINDFQHGVDHIQLMQSVFRAIGVTLDAGEFVSGNSANAYAHDANDYLIYNTDTGQLSYDPDGAGGATSSVIAVLNGHPQLTASDIWMG